MIKQLNIAIILTLLMTANSLSSQDLKKWQPLVEINLSYGGNFNLNYLDATVMPGFHFGLCHPTSDKDYFGFGIGVEFQEQQIFLPIVARYGRTFNKLLWDIDAGYAIGIWKGIEVKPDHEFQGGLALGSSFGRELTKIKGRSIVGKIGYDYRAARLELKPNGNSGAVLITDYHHHFITLSLLLII
jgi:hypothetical protein